MVERLPSMPEALCLVPSIAKAKQKAEGRRHERFSVFVFLQSSLLPWSTGDTAPKRPEPRVLDSMYYHFSYVHTL